MFQVYRQHSMERFDIDRPHLTQSQAFSTQPPTDPRLPSSPTRADATTETVLHLGRTGTAGGSPRAAPQDRASPSAVAPPEGRASLSPLPSERRAQAGAPGPSDGRASAPGVPLTNSLDAWGMACGRGGGMMAGGVEGLQAVLQDSSTALQQELRTAEAKMEV